MRYLILLLLVLPLSAQTFTLVNSTNQDLDELELFEQRDTVIKQVRDLFIAGVSGNYTFDVAAEVCLSLQDQLKTDYPTRASMILGDDNTAPCKTKITGPRARFMWDGWDWNEPAGGDGSLRTVCASGCDHTTIQAAIDASNLGDLIELEPETFGGATTGTLMTIPANHEFEGNCPTYTVIRTAGYTSNFTPGVRVTGGSNMAKLVGATDDEPNAAHVVRFEDTSSNTVRLTSANPSTEVLTTIAAHGFNPGDEIVWTNLRLLSNNWAIDGTGLFHTRRYYVLTAPTDDSFTVSETLGGPTVDITSQPTFPGNIGVRKAKWPISCWKLQGLEIAQAAGELEGPSLISMYDSSPFIDTKMSHIIFEHLYLHGADNTNQPRRGIKLDGRYVSVRDSLIEEIKQPQGTESYAIEIQDAPGPVWIENNSLSGAGMSVFIGASQVNAEYFDNGQTGGIVMRGNYLWKKPEWYLQRIAGAPSGAAHPGAQWLDTTGPTCYTATGGGTWGSADANCDNAINYEIKNSWESKGCTGCLVEGNWADLSPFGDGSQQSWLNIKVQPNSFQGWNGANDIIWYNYRSRYTASGPILRGPIGKNPKPTGPVALWNGLSTQIDNVKYRYETGVNANRMGQVGGLEYGAEIRHVTNLTNPGISAPLTLVVEPQEHTPPRYMVWFSFRDNIWATSYWDSTPSTLGCNSVVAIVSPPNVTHMEDNAWLSGGFINHSACSVVEYEETDISDFGFANPSSDDFRLTSAGTTNDYRAGQSQGAPDGKDLGVDHGQLNDALGGLDPTAGLGSWSSQHNVAITAVTDTTATVEFDRPASNSCGLTLYTDWARQTEHGDTNTSGEKLDTRSGNTVVGNHIEFSLGTNSSLTPGTHYWFEIDCASDSVLMVGSLMTSK